MTWFEVKQKNMQVHQIPNQLIPISIIIPIHNGAQWIDQCFDSINNQMLSDDISVEICVCNDASSDNTLDILSSWQQKLHKKFLLKIYNNMSATAGGVGYAKNRAVSISSGTYLCFQDIDDVMMPLRIQQQYSKALELPNDTIIGCQFKRQPDNSTVRYTKWANTISQESLYNQIYTSHGPTLIMPTWFCHRSVFHVVAGFSEGGKGTPEDLIFFYKHLDLGGKLFRVDECLLIYTYHSLQATLNVHETTIWQIRMRRLEEKILVDWPNFTIWNAGKQGRKFYNSLQSESKKKVINFCDVDQNKVGKNYEAFDVITRQFTASVKIVHFKNAVPPFVICVKLDLTDGTFEQNLTSLNLVENRDYVLFS